LAHAQFAYHDLQSGNPGVAHARLVPLLDRPGLQEHGVTALLPLLAWSHLELCQFAQAEAVLQQSLSRARAARLTLYLVEALWVQALMAIRHRQWEMAYDSLEEGLTLARDSTNPYAEARLLHLYGDMHAQQGESGLARERFEAALLIFQRLGAGKRVEQLQLALNTLQQRP
jgi:predicted negative regulator of RcsB-dependent stress response